MAEGRMLASRYRLDAVVGRGGMGTVWRAHDLMLDREVAVKEVVLPPGLSDSERSVLIERTFREARASARLNHPGVVTVHDVVEVEGSPWIVMELVRARSLQEILDQGPLEHRRVAEIGLQMLAALRHAHEKGILHRDVKPSNVLLTDSGRVVLTDFGIAQMEGDATLTQTGLVMGSPAYIPPERAQGERAVPASDLWALGATLYAALEGRSPYERSDAMSSLQAALIEPVPPPRNAGPLARVLDGLLAREPRHRMTAAQAQPLLTRVALMPAPVVPPTMSDARPEAMTSADETVLDEPSVRRGPPPDIAAETVMDPSEIAPFTRPDTGSEGRPNNGGWSAENRPSERRPAVDPDARTMMEPEWSAGPGPSTPTPWERPQYEQQQPYQWPQHQQGNDARERRKTTVIVTVAVVLVVVAVLTGAVLLRNMQ